MPHDQLGEVSLRWIYVHIIRRHAGHAGIMREQIDDATGDWQTSRQAGEPQRSRFAYSQRNVRAVMAMPTVALRHRRGAARPPAPLPPATSAL